MRLVLQEIALPLARFDLEIDLEINARTSAVFGPSGAGKTSLLDLIAGLRRPNSGRIALDDRVLTDRARGFEIPTRRRGVGYVPQDLALFPHLSVRQNLLYGWRRHRQPPPRTNAYTFEEIVELLEIEPLLARGVRQLSGGEQQRVALARALLAQPELLLLDEPLASLDAKLKSRVIPYLLRIRDEFQIPMLYVTHDRLEALTLAEEMIVLLDGKVAQAGPVQQVINRPANLELAQLLTIETVQPGRIIQSDGALLTIAVGTTNLLAVEQNLPANVREVFVCIRAEDVVLLKGAHSPSSARNHLSGTIQSMTRQGPLMKVDLDCGFALAVLLTKQACEELALKAHDPVIALVKASNIHLIPR